MFSAHVGSDLNYSPVAADEARSYATALDVHTQMVKARYFVAAQCERRVAKK
jgi:hypothetical protein